MSAFQALSLGKTVQLPIVGRAADVDVGCADGVAVGVSVGAAVAGALAVGDDDGRGDDEDRALGDVAGEGDASGVAVAGAADGVPPPPEQPADTTIEARAIQMRIRYVRRVGSPA